MFDGFRAALLGWFRVPPEPDPPAGSPGSIRVFRAGRNFYRLALLRWGLVQFFAGLPILFVLLIFSPFDLPIDPMRRAPEWVRTLFYTVDLIALAIFAVQLVVSYAVLRLNYELRWYIVTDRSLRIRSGIWSVREMTMTFANIQQVNISQGPLERVLGVANLVVTSAGGGGKAGPHGSVGPNSHDGRFEGVDNAGAIRDLILDRLRHYRDAGLGDPDEKVKGPGGTPAAAQELLEEVRSLRAALSGGSVAS